MVKPHPTEIVTVKLSCAAIGEAGLEGKITSTSVGPVMQLIKFVSVLIGGRDIGGYSSEKYLPAKAHSAKG